jgi:hypothetical protein
VLITGILAIGGNAGAASVIYVRADQPTTPSYTVEGVHNVSPDTAAISVSRSSTGMYSVDLGATLLVEGGNVQVTALGNAPGYCKSFGWTARSVSVACFDMLGNAEDSGFTLLVTLPDDDGDIAYVLADDATANSYSPSAEGTSPSYRGRITIERTGTGFYRVLGSGIAGDNINLQVTAVGRDSAYCSIGNWRPGRATVECFAPGGTRPRGVRADSRFFLLATREAGLQAAYAWNYDETARSYSLVERNGSSSDGDPVSVVMADKGRYEVDLGPILDDGGSVQVSARSSLPGVCNLEDWAGSTATVRCFDLDGVPEFMEFNILARRAIPSLIADIDRESPLPAGPDIPAGGGETPTVIDFDVLADGTAIAPESLLRFEYRDAGAVFPDGVRVHRCGGSYPCTTASTTNQAAAPQRLTEFRNRSLDITLTRGRQRLSFYVVADSTATTAEPVSVTAFDLSGTVVDTASTLPLRPGAETLVTVRSSEPNIARVQVSTGAPGSNLLHVDNLALYGTGPLFPAFEEPTGPVISFVRPNTAARLESEVAEVEVQASHASDIASIDVQVQMLGGEVLVPYSEGSVCGGASLCGSGEVRGTIDVTMADAGFYRIFARACATTGECSVARRQVERVYPERQDVDLWVMGLEYNQHWQDTIYTDLLNDGSEPGRVPLSQPSDRDTELSLPIVAGKPMVVRAYVGLRDGAEADRVPVTGTLRVNDGTSGGRSWVFSPLENRTCQDHLGNRLDQGCRSRIVVTPTLGDQGYLTNTPYDIDLIQRRITWEGTLNFVLPAEVTDTAIGPERGGTGLTFDLEVFPLDQYDESANPDGAWNEINPRDNAFQLQLENTIRETLNVRLVRVSMTGAPAPSRADARRALDEAGRLLPVSGIDVDVDSEFFYDGAAATVRTEFLGYDISTTNLRQCNTLWLQLYFRYGLDPDRPLVALVPEAVDGCNGVGWDVPNLEVLREGRGRELTFAGGIAHSRMPDYSSGDDWGRVAILAMEVMHAWKDMRHVSNLHGEDEGCPLTDGGNGALLGFVTDAVGLGLDMRCFRPEVHPHAAVGSYPPTVVRVGRPGDVSGTLGGNRVFGNLGGFGVRIDPDGAGYRLTMYDPCPTGPLDPDDPLTRLGQRIDPETGYRCDLPGGNDDRRIPHDVMSYGNPAANRWYAIQVTPGLKNPREGL